MYQVRMTEENLLVQKIEFEKKTQFEMGGDADKRGAVFKVCHAPEGSEFKADDLLLLRPETYPGLYFDEVLYTVIHESDVLAKLTEKTND